MLPAPDLHDKRTSEQALYLDESDDQRTVGNTAATAIASVTATTNNNNTAATTTTTTVAAVVTVALIPTIITFKHNIRGSSGSSSNRCSSSSFSSKGGGNSIHTFWIMGTKLQDNTSEAKSQPWTSTKAKLPPPAKRKHFKLVLITRPCRSVDPAKY